MMWVYNGSGEPALKQLMDQYDKTGGTVIGCQVVKPEQVSAYGIIDGEETDDHNLLKVKDMVEKPSVEEAPSRFCRPGTVRDHPGCVRCTGTDPAREGWGDPAHRRLRVMAHNESVYAYNFEGKRYDTGDKLGYLKAPWNSLCGDRTWARRSRPI